jgi:type IV pilus assembly protein PilB
MSQRLGELLTRAGRVTHEQLQMAADQQRLAGGGFIGSYLVQNGVLSEEELAATISDELGVSIIELKDLKIEDSVLSLIPQNIINKHNLLPIIRQDSTLTVAMIDPSNMVALNDVKFLTGLDVKVVVAKESELKKTYKKHFEQQTELEQIDQGNDNPPDSLGSENIVDSNLTSEDLPQDYNNQAEVDEDNYVYQPADSGVIKLVDAILTDAIKKRASDLHFEPYEKSFRIRYRIDGILYEALNPSLKVKNPIIARLKMMANLDIEENRVPQEGSIKLLLSQDNELECKINVLPTSFGEKLVIKFFDRSNLHNDIAKLGFEPSQYQLIKKSIYNSNGLVVVSGASGCGKTTTLYTMLSELSTKGLNVTTIGESIQSYLPGINQYQINNEIGLNNYSLLNVLLRQDPDVIMMEDLSDRQTLECAIKAFDSGHLVLSTLNTSDVASTLFRLLTVNTTEPHIFSSVSCVISQKLIRKVCQKCADQSSEDAQLLTEMGYDLNDIKQLSTIKTSKGCECCMNTGYSGRVAIFEVLSMTDQIKSQISNCKTYSELLKIVCENGMKTFKSSALKLLKDGVTTLDEIKRVLS